MKVAVSADGGAVSPHFGRCAEYVLAEISDAQIMSTETLPNPGHTPGALPQILGELGVECIIAGGMGPRAKTLFDGRGIRYVTGVTGTVDDVLALFATGELEEGEEICER